MEAAMGNLFAGLESLGLNIKDTVDVYEKEKKENQSADAKKAQVKEVQEEDLLFDKTYTCPVCDHEFKRKMVRTGKAKLISADTDLRPKYQGIDPLKYDAILCPKCGYASLNRYFNFVMSSQAKMIREKISATYHYVPEGEKVYTYDEAITRHKMALLNTIVKHGKTSERAYTCLKIAWLFRGKREELMKGDYKKEEAAALLAEEKEFLKNAHEGFVTAFSKEDFPMCGMDEISLRYIMAVLAHDIGKIEDSVKLLASVLNSRTAPRRIKDKALDLKEKIKQEVYASQH